MIAAGEQTSSPQLSSKPETKRLTFRRSKVTDALRAMKSERACGLPRRGEESDRLYPE